MIIKTLNRWQLGLKFIKAVVSQWKALRRSLNKTKWKFDGKKISACIEKKRS